MGSQYVLFSTGIIDLNTSTNTDLNPQKVYWSITTHQREVGCQIFLTSQLASKADLCQSVSPLPPSDITFQAKRLILRAWTN